MDSLTVATASGWLAWLTPMGFVSALAWAVVRTKSRHLLLRRIWQLLHGNREIADPDIRAFVDEETSLASFHLFSGLWVRTLQDAKDLICWTRANKVTMWSLRLAGDYFDADARRIRVEKLPGPAWQRAKQFVCWTGYVLTFFLLWCALVADSAPFKLKATSRYFLLNADSARVIWPPTIEGLHAAGCTAAPLDNARRTNFAEQEVVVVCQLLQTPELKDLVKTERYTWRWSLFGVSLLVACVTFMVLHSWLQVEAAKKIAGRRLNPSFNNGQLELDFGDVSSPLRQERV